MKTEIKKTLDLKLLYITSIFIPFANYISDEVFLIAGLLWIGNVSFSRIYSRKKQNYKSFVTIYVQTTILLVMATLILDIVIKAS